MHVPMHTVALARPLVRRGSTAEAKCARPASVPRPMRSRSVFGDVSQVQAASMRDTSGMQSFAANEGEAGAGPSLREQGLQDYAELKGEIMGNTAKLGAFLTLYLGVTQHDNMGFVSTAIGLAGSLAYVALLCYHVDTMRKETVSALPSNRNPGENLVALFGSALSRVGDVYKNALWHPQLLVPVALAAGCSQWNQLDMGPDILYFDVLIGFFTYKLVVLDQGWRALKKVMFLDEKAPPPLPAIRPLNESDDLLK